MLRDNKIEDQIQLQPLQDIGYENIIEQMLIPSLTEEFYPFLTQSAFLTGSVYSTMTNFNQQTKQKYAQYFCQVCASGVNSESSKIVHTISTKSQEGIERLKQEKNQFHKMVQLMIDDIFPQQNENNRQVKIRQITQRFYGYSYYLLKYKPQQWGKFCRSEIQHNAVLDIYIKPDKRSVFQKWLYNQQENYQSGGQMEQSQGKNSSDSIWVYLAKNCQEQIAKFQKKVAGLDSEKEKHLFLETMTKFRFFPHTLQKSDIRKNDPPLQKFIGYIFTLTNIWVQRYVTFLSMLQSGSIIQYLYFVLGYKLYTAFLLHMEDSMAYLLHQYDQIYIKLNKQILGKEIQLPKFSFWNRALTIWSEKINTCIPISKFFQINQCQKCQNVYLGPFFLILLHMQIQSMKNCVDDLNTQQINSKIEENLQEQNFANISNWRIKDNEKSVWDQIKRQNLDFYYTHPTSITRIFTQFITNKDVTQNTVLWTGFNYKMQTSGLYKEFEFSLKKYNDLVLKKVISTLTENVSAINSFLIYRSIIISSYNYLFNQYVSRQIYSEWDKQEQQKYQKQKPKMQQNEDPRFRKYFTSLRQMLERINDQVKYLNEKRGNQLELATDEKNNRLLRIQLNGLYNQQINTLLGRKNQESSKIQSHQLKVKKKSPKILKRKYVKKKIFWFKIKEYTKQLSKSQCTIILVK